MVPTRMLLVPCLVATTQAAMTDIVTSKLCPCASPTQVAIWATSTPAENSTYGVGCARHELMHELATPACTQTAGDAVCDGTVIPMPAHCESGGSGFPEYCDDAWCYVNPSNCKLANTGSTIVPGAAFSYAACGAMDEWSTGVTLAQSLSGKTLRVGFAKNSGGWMGSYHPVGHGVRDERWSGPTVEFITLVAERAGFYINITDPPEDIKSNGMTHTDSSSSFTQLVYATALGYLDFSVALFTVTSQRNSMAHFFVLEAQPIYAVSREVDRSLDLTSGFSIISRPFTTNVWLLFLLTMLLLNILFAMQEFGMSGSMFEFASEGESAPKGGTPQRRRSWSVKALEDFRNRLDRDGDGRVSIMECKQYLLAVLESSYFGWLSITSGGVAHTAVSPGGRVTLIGFGVFILLAITQYTSTLTSQMVTTAQSSVIHSVDEAIQQGLKFCGERMDSNQMLLLYPRAIFLPDPSDGIVGFASRAQVYPAIDSGECDVAISAAEDLQKHRSEGLHCDKAIIGKEPVYTVNWGMPLTDSLSRGLAYHMNEAKIAGLWDALKMSRKPASQCGAQNSSNDQVSVGQFLAVSSISVGISILGFLLTCIARGRGSRLLTTSKTHPHALPVDKTTTM